MKTTSKDVTFPGAPIPFGQQGHDLGAGRNPPQPLLRRHFHMDNRTHIHPAKSISHGQSLSKEVFFKKSFIVFLFTVKHVAVVVDDM